MTKSGRYSLYKIVSIIKKNTTSIKNIYLPSFICKEVISSLSSFDLNILFYKLNDDLSPDIDFLKNNLKRKSILLIVNYFGVLSSWSTINEIKNEYELITIEDNCHSLNEKNGVGSYGDYSFNSLRKIIPLLSGSEININTTDIIPEANNLKLRIPDIDEIKYLLRSYRNKKSIKTVIDASEDNEMISNEKGIDYISKKILNNNKFDINQICLTRRHNFISWNRFLPNNELRSFHIDIDKVFCPYVYPCIAESNNIKRKWLKWGTENNIRIINWPKIPFESHDHFGNSQLNMVLLFPVNHQFNLPIRLN